MVSTQFSPAQPNALRILNRKNSEANRNKWFSVKICTRDFSETAWELARQFGKRTTIHGMDRLLNESSGRCERSIWLIAVILAFLGSIYVCLILSNRFNEGKFETVIDDTRMPVYNLTYPVVTICNENRLNWERLKEAQDYFLPNEKSAVKLKLFERVIATYDNIHFAGFDKFNVLQDEPLELLNNVNFSMVFDFMTWRCEEFFENCIWNHFPVKCCDVFLKRKTKKGFCWAFNTLESEEGRQKKLIDPFYPWRVSGAGPGSALNVRVLINPTKLIPNRTNELGISVMIAEPYVWHTEPIMVSANTKSNIDVIPTIHVYTKDTKGVTSTQRKCVFKDEFTSEDYKTLDGYVYMHENCEAECQQEYLMKYCNCTTDLLFPPGQYPPCKTSDLICLANNNDYFRYFKVPGEEEYVHTHYEGMLCKCLPNCYSFIYDSDMRSSQLIPNILENESYVDLDVHYRFDTMMVYRTSLVFGWVDLIVAFGGIVGLFLGCSLISAMELAYFTLIELPKFISEKLKQKQPDPNTEIKDIRGKLCIKNFNKVPNRISDIGISVKPSIDNTWKQSISRNTEKLNLYMHT